MSKFLSVIFFIICIGIVGVSEAQVTQGTVFSKTQSGTGVAIGSGGVGSGLNVYCLGGTCGSAATTYLDADAIVDQTTSAVHGQLYGYNGVTWDRLRSTIVGGLQVNCITGCAGGSSTPTDAFANPTTAGLQQTFNMGFNGVTWDRLRSTIAGGLLVDTELPTAILLSDALANPTTPLIGAATLGWNGATFERLRTAGDTADALVTEACCHLQVISHTYGFNGATWDRMRGTVAGGLLVDVSDLFLLDATLTGRFPVGSIPADNESNAATISRIGNFNYVFDGAAWDRWTGAVTQSGTWNIGTVTTLTGITNTVTVQGTKSNNAVVPGTNNEGVLPCVANAASPSYTETFQVGCSTNLSGATRTIEQNFVATANNDGSCASGAVSFTAIASNASRTWLAVWASPANTDDVYLRLGATATAADARFAPGQPLNFTAGRIYTGIIDAFPASGTQAVCVMELN